MTDSSKLLNTNQTGVIGLRNVLDRASNNARGPFVYTGEKDTEHYYLDSKGGHFQGGSSIEIIRDKTSTIYKYSAYIDRTKEKGSFGTNYVHVTAYDDNGDGIIDRYVAQDVKKDPNAPDGRSLYERAFVNDSNNGYGDGKDHFREVEELPDAKSKYAWYDSRGWFE